MLTWSSWFAEVGRLSTEAGMRERLVLGRERSRRHLRDHEARVESALLHQESRQLAQRIVDQHGEAPLGERPDLGDRERQVVGGERDRLGVEVAAREHFTSLPKTSGLSETPFASRRSVRATSWICWRQAPATCGWQRSE
jgi:hypothetical protein